MSDRGETPRVPDLEFPDRTPVGNTAPANYPEAPTIAAEIMAAAEAAQHGGNRGRDGSDRPEPGQTTVVEKPNLHKAGAGDRHWDELHRYMES